MTKDSNSLVMKYYKMVNMVLKHYIAKTDARYNDWYQDGLIVLIETINHCLETDHFWTMESRIREALQKFYSDRIKEKNKEILFDLDSIEINYDAEEIWETINLHIYEDEAISSIKNAKVREFIKTYFSPSYVNGPRVEVARAMGITPEAARRYYNNGLRLLRHPKRVMMISNKWDR